MTTPPAARMVVIGDPDAVFGLGLLGLEGFAVAGPEEARRSLESVLRDPTVGVVLLTEDWADLLREIVDRRAGTETGPLVVEIPSPGASRAAMTLHERVERVLGVRLEV